MRKFTLPVMYDQLNAKEKKAVREQYVEEQNGKCMHCGEDLNAKPPKRITDLKIDWKFFPPFFLKHNVHLQHDHFNGLTEGAIHAYCNAVLWQYHGK